MFVIFVTVPLRMVRKVVSSGHRFPYFFKMRQLSIPTRRIATLIILHAAGVGFASPSVLVTRPAVTVEWLPRDNQTVYHLASGEVRKLELNTSSITDTRVFISVSPCTRDVRWAVYRGNSGCSDGHLTLVSEYSAVNGDTFSTVVTRRERYVLQLSILQLSSLEGGAAAVSVRGESGNFSRLRLRVRSRRRLSASWDPSPIDPQATSYCVVASHRRTYTSLCAAQYDVKINRLENKSNRFGIEQSNRFDRLQKNISYNMIEASTEVDNSLDADADIFNNYDVNFRSTYRRKKFSRSTKVSEEDPVIACVGERTHHLIENLDPSTTYFVSVFGVGRDRRAGQLLASGNVRPRTSVAKRLRENVPYKTDIKGRIVLYFKATIGPGGGLWLAVTTCTGAVDIEVLVRGKRLYSAKNIDPHRHIFVPAPILTSSVQETSDEGSVQFDSSSSEEARMRYVIKMAPSRREVRNSGVGIEVTASTTRWGMNTPELAAEDGATVRELRPRRSCRSVDIAFLPALHHASDIIRYCITARENGENINACHSTKNSSAKMQCVDHSQRLPAKVIVQKVAGLQPGKKYAIQVSASSNGNSVPYKTLYVDTNVSCSKG